MLFGLPASKVMYWNDINYYISKESKHSLMCIISGIISGELKRSVYLEYYYEPDHFLVSFSPRINERCLL